MLTGVETLNGMRAVKTLLAGAKQTHSQYLVRQFEKPGTYDQVLKEFNSVHPTHVQDFDLPGVVCEQFRCVVRKPIFRVFDQV